MSSSSGIKTKQKQERPPSRTLEGRENQMISLAFDAAEKRLRDGTASSQMITHYLKLGSVREQKELELLKQELELKKAKTASIASEQDIKILYTEALKAMRTYTGSKGRDDDE